MLANSMVSELQNLAHYSIIETVGIYTSFTSIVDKSKGGSAVKSGAYLHTIDDKKKKTTSFSIFNILV